MMERLSDLIGTVYDCVLDPDGWQDAMRRICEEIECVFSTILLLDVAQRRIQFFKEWNTDPQWLSRYDAHVDDMARLYEHQPSAFTRPIDEPLVLSRDLPEDVWRNTDLFREWAQPQGICDSLQTMVLRKPGSIGLFAANRHESIGPARDQDLEILRFLAPHVRRAVTISDLLDLKKLESQALASSLDHIAAGIVVVAENQRILHANSAAERLFGSNGPVRSRGGRLVAADPYADAELTKAVTAARTNEAALGAAGIGVRLSGSPDETAMAHVLPLAAGELRTRLMQQAVAAIFITSGSKSIVIDLAAVAASFGFTNAELRLVQELLGGGSLVQAAATLGISVSTAKAHMSHIFSKAGITRQADLIALLHRLAPPVAPRSPPRSL